MNLSKEDIADAVGRYRRKVDTTIIAELAGVSRKQMVSILREEGVYASKSKVVLRRDNPVVWEMYNKGMADFEIAEQHGCESSQVRDWRRRNGLRSNWQVGVKRGYKADEK
jgi:hypothetical protein